MSGPEINEVSAEEGDIREVRGETSERGRGEEVKGRCRKDAIY